MEVAQTAGMPMKLHVRVYSDTTLRHPHRKGSTSSILARMHPNAPFRDLLKKLRKRYGDGRLALHRTPYSRILDSDTPASVSTSS